MSVYVASCKLDDLIQTYQILSKMMYEFIKSKSSFGFYDSFLDERQYAMNGFLEQMKQNLIDACERKP